MKTVHILLASGLLLALAVPGFCDDEQKAEKQLHKIAAMATDATGKRVVSITIADTLGVKRSDLVTERRDTSLNYADTFVAHELVKNGAKMSEIAAQLKSGKTISQIASEQHADWKQIGADAKKLNSKMEDNLYKHFLNGKATADRDRADNYDVMFDGVPADNQVSKDDIAEAQHTYSLWKDRADQHHDAKLDASKENAARGVRGDPIDQQPNGGNPPQ